MNRDVGLAGRIARMTVPVVYYLSHARKEARAAAA